MSVAQFVDFKPQDGTIRGRGVGGKRRLFYVFHFLTPQIDEMRNRRR